YLRPETLGAWWSELDALVREQVRGHPGGAQAWLRDANPQWRFVGRVALHLAENKRDEEHPFAFLATYVKGLSPQGQPQHEPLSRALQAYAGARNRAALLALLTPLQKAGEKSGLVRELVDSGDVYHPLVWTPREAHRFLQDVPVLEEAGLVVRVPDWWKRAQPPRVAAEVRIGSSRAGLGAGEILDFSVNAALDGEPLSEEELRNLLSSSGGLVRLKGKWVELDRAKLEQALAHWREVEDHVRRDGLTFFEGMRLLAGATLERDAGGGLPASDREWAGVTAGPALKAMLDKLGSPEERRIAPPASLRAELRPYQRDGLGWLRFLARLGLGACLADDMGLGKTVQVIALLLALKEEAPSPDPSLLVVPASLIANWKAELDRFAPSLRYAVVHPSEPEGEGADLVITTYGVLQRQEALRARKWRLAILDEAQAIKNPGTKQTKAAKEVKAAARVALTGTPVENRLGDLWSLFDFLNPGLLGSAGQFGSLVKRMEGAGYGPLRSLVGPY
ncbi:MAG: DEAD/DEAH box helicase, partial [Gemmataceae bacterium]|nr:DEAD/DEAH box helicase [Gemmataceae bacterium]